MRQNDVVALVEQNHTRAFISSSKRGTSVLIGSLGIVSYSQNKTMDTGSIRTQAAIAVVKTVSSNQPMYPFS